MLSPKQLNSFLGCEHRTYLDILRARGEIPDEDYLPPRDRRLLDHGIRHEEEILAQLRETHDVVSFGMDGDRAAHAAATEAAMRSGREVIHQACFFGNDRLGYADFLIRVDTPSRLGGFSYEVHDAKLGRSPRPAYIFQLLFYTDEVERIQGVRPARMHLILGDGERPPFAPEDFDAYAARVLGHFLQRREELADGAAPEYPYPVADCHFCPYWKRCETRRRDDVHVSLVAGLRRRDGMRLESAGVRTVDDIAAMPPGFVVERVTGATLDGLRVQAHLQVASRGLERPLHEHLPLDPGRGFDRLPEPAEGDVFFDFEGDPYFGEHPMRYLFGTLYREGGEWRHWALWALDPAGEKAAFERWMGWIGERLRAHPDLHVFHYNSYEPAAIKDMLQRYGTREHEVDELLRRHVFVDLYGVVRQSMRVGVESYGLKSLEALFGYRRTAELGDAIGSLRRWQDYLEDRSRTDLLEEIAAYNEDDCRSTLALYRWLLRERPPEVHALEPEPPREPTDSALAFQARLAAARERLGDGLLVDLLGYHRRDAKPEWWAYFARLLMTPDELREQDSEALGCLTPAGERVDDGQSWLIPLAFPEQDFKISAGAAVDPASARGVTVTRVDEDERVVWIRRGKRSDGMALPHALIPGAPIPTTEQQNALFAYAESAMGPSAATDILLRRPPRLARETPPLSAGDVDIEVLRAQVAALDRSALFVQGPPGSGKTWTGARLAVDLLRRGRRVGVVATSHKAIANLLDEIVECAAQEGVEFTGLKKSSAGDPDSLYDRGPISSTSDNAPFPGDYGLVAGTPWLWAREQMREAVDVLFVDEAGQLALADAIAIAQGAGSVVLLGDPQQLAHVSQGTHPDGSGVSVLEHLLGERDTVDAAGGMGVFLNRTWRMHPDVCRFVSDAMYDGLLEPVAGAERQRIDSRGLSGAGLRLVAVDHEDRRQRAIEEAHAIAREYELLLGGSYVDRDGIAHPIMLDDILVVAPFNAQVRCLRAKLPKGARVGTVDKFQGQEAPVVFFSMTSSSGEDVPRGMDFLFSRNRLNVAVSRAQALAVVVCSPRLLWARCSTVEQMRLVNLLARFAATAHAA